jgi:hypothetical protein
MSTASAPSDVKAAAAKLVIVGLWVVVIEAEKKNPIGNAWGLSRKDIQEINRLLTRFRGSGLGVCLGPERGPGGKWLVDLEGDGDQADETLAGWFGGEVIRTATWSSARGNHYLFLVDGERLLNLLSACKAVEGKGPGKVGAYHLESLPGLEIRCGGYKEDRTVKQVQSVIPPTRGTDGKPRQWIEEPEIIAELPDAAYAFLEAQAEGIREREAIASEPTNGHGAHLAGDSSWPNTRVEDLGRNREKAYTKGALRKIVDEFKSQIEGNRHAYILEKSNVMASMVKTGWISEQECLDAFKAGAIANGMGQDRFPEIEELWRSVLGRVQPHDPLPHNRESLDAKLVKRMRTDLGNGERLVARHGTDFRYCHPWKKPLVWDGARWSIDQTATSFARPSTPSGRSMPRPPRSPATMNARRISNGDGSPRAATGSQP